MNKLLVFPGVAGLLAIAAVAMVWLFDVRYAPYITGCFAVLLFTALWLCCRRGQLRRPLIESSKQNNAERVPVTCTAAQPEPAKMKSGKDGRWVEVCDACSIAWELDGKELLADGKCLKCSGTVRSVWYPFPPKESVAQHHVGAADYRAGKARDELHCTKCRVTWTGVNAKPHGGYWVSPEYAEAFKAMRCPGKDCGGELRKPLLGERFGLYVYPSTHKPSEAMTAQDYLEQLQGMLQIDRAMRMRAAGASDEEIRKVFWGTDEQADEKPADPNPATA